jgi:hypothetical protein
MKVGRVPSSDSVVGVLYEECGRYSKLKINYLNFIGENDGGRYGRYQSEDNIKYDNNVTDMVICYATAPKYTLHY